MKTTPTALCWLIWAMPLLAQEPSAPPANDAHDQAHFFQTLPFIDVATNAGATTRDSEDVLACITPSHASVWWRTLGAFGAGEGLRVTVINTAFPVNLVVRCEAEEIRLCHGQAAPDLTLYPKTPSCTIMVSSRDPAQTGPLTLVVAKVTDQIIRHLTVHNFGLGGTVTGLAVRVAGTDAWVAPRAEVSLAPFERQANLAFFLERRDCTADLRATLADGTTHEVPNLDLCKSQVVTLKK